MHLGVQTLIHYTIILVFKTEPPLFFEKMLPFCVSELSKLVKLTFNDWLYLRE